MSRHSFLLPSDLAAYYDPLITEQPEPLARLAAWSDSLADGRMRSSPEAGRFLAMLVRLMGAKRLIEVGVFTGYGTAWLADAIPADGTVFAYDVTDEHLAVGRQTWQAMGLEERIRVTLGPATETLAQTLDQEGPGTFDFAFIDADKTGYPAYYDLGKRLIRTGGLLVFDNALLGGRIASDDGTDAAVTAMRTVTERAFADPDVEASLVLLGDGLLLVRKTA